MGTIVLPPQDCLSSPHNLQNSYFPSARPEIGRRLQAVMAPSPAAQDCARHGHGGGSPPGDGILPVPPINGQARVLSKRSPRKALSSSTSTSTSTSTFCTPLQRPCQESTFLKKKPELPRSGSAILPTPLIGSPPLAEGLLKGRLPFKVVQGNGPGNNKDYVQGGASKKSNIARNGVRKITTASQTSSTKTNGNIDKLKSSSKSHQDAIGFRGQSKEINVRTRRSLERSNSAKGTLEKSGMANLPVVSILQRPKTEEAAMELFAKFFQKDTKQVFEQTDEGMDVMSDESGEACRMFKESVSETQSDVEDVSESEFSDMVLLSSPKSMTGVSQDVEASALTDAGVITTPFEVGTLVDGEPWHGSETRVVETGCEELVPWERWAGPSFINSPPPSALPLPRFSRKLLKDAILDNMHVEHLEGVAAADQFSTPPSSISPLYTSLARQRHLNINLDAVATATKDLKRILNLDLCRM